MPGQRSVNEVILIGWVANEPQLKENQNGQKLTVFNLGTRRFWTTKDGEPREEVQYHKIATWGKLAERAHKLLRKGARVYIRGYLHNRKVQVEGEQKPRVITEVVVNDLLVLDRRRRGGSREGGEGESAEGAEEAVSNGDEE